MAREQPLMIAGTICKCLKFQGKLESDDSRTRTEHPPEGLDYRMLTTQLERLPNVTFRVHREVGSEVTLTEIYLIGNTAALTIEQMQVLPCVAKVVRVSEPYRVLGRHKQGDDRPASFDYNGVQFGQDSVNVFAG